MLGTGVPKASIKMCHMEMESLIIHPDVKQRDHSSHYEPEAGGGENGRENEKKSLRIYFKYGSDVREISIFYEKGISECNAYDLKMRYVVYWSLLGQ